MAEYGYSLIKIPRQLITVIALAFIVPVILIILTGMYVVRSVTGGSPGSDAMTERAIAERMRLIGFVAIADASAGKSSAEG